MRRVLSILLLVSPVMLWGKDTPPDNVAPARQTGDYLLKVCTASALTPSGRLRRQYCAGYLAGVVETLRVVTPSKAGFCPPGQEMTTRALTGIYTHYMAVNPDSHGRAAATIATHALRQAFPCGSEPSEEGT